VAVVVTHAGTVDEGDASVTLDVRVTARPVEGMLYEVEFDVPSGRLDIGDADGEDQLILRPGRWLLQFGLDDPAEARAVEIVASPL